MMGKERKLIGKAVFTMKTLYEDRRAPVSHKKNV